jgi:hypothetical protein
MGLKPCKNSHRARDKNGYHRINKNGYYHEHRWLYATHHNVKLTHLDIVRHLCNNPWCVEITHLELGNHADNRADASAVGKTTTPAAKLTEAQIKEIRKKYKTGKYTMAEIAKEFKLHKNHVQQIIRFKVWKEIKT